MLNVVCWQDLDEAGRRALLARPAQSASAETAARVRDILDAVRDRGNDAVREFTLAFDGVDLDDFAVPDDEFRAAEESLGAEALRAIDAAIANVRRFHEAQLPQALAVETTPGVVCRRVSRPIDAVGLYVPAGTAPLPSAAIMLAVPAAIAGCPTRVMCTPPRPDGSADPAVLVAARRAGVNRVFRIGGAQAIGAMAYGTDTVPRVGRIFGPGNAWVTMAKTLVAADPAGAAIDMPAGPSEVLVIADENARPDFVAADLLSQAEHGTDSQVMLLTTSRQAADSVAKAVAVQLEQLPRRDIARAALSNSRLVVVNTLDDAIDVSNEYAPEHLILQCTDAREYVDRVRNAGSVFVGEWSPESVGDYCSGTNHVLPTYGYARNYSGLGVDQFLRTMTVQELTRPGLAALAPTVVALAGLEGLDAHAQAVRLRLEADA